MHGRIKYLSKYNPNWTKSTQHRCEWHSPVYPVRFFTIFRVLFPLFSSLMQNCFISGLILTYSRHTHTLDMQVKQEHWWTWCVNLRTCARRLDDRKHNICDHKTWREWRTDELCQLSLLAFESATVKVRENGWTSPFNSRHMRGNQN